jgi:hypothetical protein
MWASFLQKMENSDGASAQQYLGQFLCQPNGSPHWWKTSLQLLEKFSCKSFPSGMGESSTGDIAEAERDVWHSDSSQRAPGVRCQEVFQRKGVLTGVRHSSLL